MTGIEATTPQATALQATTHQSSSTALRTGRPTRILIVRVGAMGDILHALPAATALRQALPDAWIGWALEPHWMPLLASSPEHEPAHDSAPQRCSMPLVDRVHPVPARAWSRRPFSLQTAREIAVLRREIRDAHYDIAVDLQGSIRSAVIGCMAGRGRLFGSSRPRESAARLLYGHRVDCPGTHVITQAVELLHAATGLPLAAAPACLPLDAEAEAWRGATLSRLGLKSGGDGGYILLAPQAGWGAKQWGLERFAALARALSAAGFPVLVNAQPGDAALAAHFAGSAPVVPATLAQLIALTREAALVIGGDTGPVHLAAALGRPVVALFGPTDPARNGPQFPGATVRILRHPTSRTDHRRHPETEAGLAAIPVEAVVQAALDLLQPASSAAASPSADFEVRTHAC